jgi:hypothetical protein
MRLECFERLKEMELVVIEARKEQICIRIYTKKKYIEPNTFETIAYDLNSPGWDYNIIFGYNEVKKKLFATITYEAKLDGE